MPSPFPGMDPYLESPPFWADLHGMLISMMKMELKKRLPDKYSVWTDTYIWLHVPDAETRRGKPDVLVGGPLRNEPESSIALLPAPASTMLPAIRREGNKYLKIKEVRADRIVTVVELLSPANKEPGEVREAFLAKRNDYLANRTNVVEIDLHRAGQRLPLGEPAPPVADYYAFVSRAAEFPRTAIWPFGVRDKLPEIAIPLDPEDGFVLMPLQSCFDAAYDQGPYYKEVDYTKPPRPPMAKADAAWVRKLLAE